MDQNTFRGRGIPFPFVFSPANPIVNINSPNTIPRGSNTVIESFQPNVPPGIIQARPMIPVGVPPSLPQTINGQQIGNLLPSMRDNERATTISNPLMRHTQFNGILPTMQERPIRRIDPLNQSNVVIGNDQQSIARQTVQNNQRMPNIRVNPSSDVAQPPTNGSGTAFPQSFGYQGQNGQLLPATAKASNGVHFPSRGGVMIGGSGLPLKPQSPMRFASIPPVNRAPYPSNDLIGRTPPTIYQQPKNIDIPPPSIYMPPPQVTSITTVNNNSNPNVLNVSRLSNDNNPLLKTTGAFPI
jgi:hypothetical protein